MRRYLVAGNWKLNLGPGAGRDLASAVGERLRGRTLHGDVLVCPPFVTIPAVATVAKGDPVMLGAQTCSAHENGAYTGEVAADMLKEAGVQYVIVGHSERRQYHRETDDEFRAKIDRVHAHGLKAIFCFGELLDERQSGRAEEVVRAQLTGVLPRLEGPNAYNLVLAYEPVWAIGTGKVATTGQAQEVHAFLRATLTDLYGEVAQSIRIQYGGSVKPDNIAGLMAQTDIDGALVGGASLKADSFVAILRNCG